MSPSPRFVPPTKTYSGYVFDCDGTLADTMPLHFRAWREALQRGGARFDFDWDLFVSRAGMSLVRTVEQLNLQFGERLDPSQIAHDQARVYQSLEHTVRPIEAVVTFAREVSKHSPIAVASGSLRVSVQRTLELIGIPDLFPIVVTPEDVEHGKPAPDMFLLAAEKMGVEAEKCLVLEDAELGFRAARAAGMDLAIVHAPPRG